MVKCKNQASSRKKVSGYLFSEDSILRNLRKIVKDKYPEGIKNNLIVGYAFKKLLSIKSCNPTPIQQAKMKHRIKSKLAFSWLKINMPS